MAEEEECRLPIVQKVPLRGQTKEKRTEEEEKVKQKRNAKKCRFSCNGFALLCIILYPYPWRPLYLAIFSLTRAEIK
jgi:hypothetical protein